MSEAEGDVVLLEAVDTVVGECDVIDVAREVEQGMLTGSDLLSSCRRSRLHVTKGHLSSPPWIRDRRIKRTAQQGVGPHVL